MSELSEGTIAIPPKHKCHELPAQLERTWMQFSPKFLRVGRVTCTCVSRASAAQSKLAAVADNTMSLVVCEIDYPVVPGWYNPVGDPLMVRAIQSMHDSDDTTTTVTH